MVGRVLLPLDNSLITSTLQLTLHGEDPVTGSKASLVSTVASVHELQGFVRDFPSIL